MFDKQKNGLMNNAMAYIAPKNETMTHSMSLKVESDVWQKYPSLGLRNTVRQCSI